MAKKHYTEREDGDRQEVQGIGPPHQPLRDGPRNPLISTKAGFDRQAQNGPFKTPGC